MSTTENRPWRVWLVPKGYRMRATDKMVRETDWIQICSARFIPFGLAQESSDEYKTDKNKIRVSDKMRHKYVLGEFHAYDEAVDFANKIAAQKGYWIDAYA